MSGIINSLLDTVRGKTSLEVAKEGFAEAMSDHTGTDVRFIEDKKIGEGK